MWQEHRSVILLGVVLLFLYFALFSCSTRGYGYLGHSGYRSSPSFFYWGGTGKYYPSQSVRTGSTGGPTSRGGGIRGGK